MPPSARSCGRSCAPGGRSSSPILTRTPPRGSAIRRSCASGRASLRGSSCGRRRICTRRRPARNMTRSAPPWSAPFRARRSRRRPPGPRWTGTRGSAASLGGAPSRTRFPPWRGSMASSRPRRRTRRRPSRATARRSCGRCAPCCWTCAAAWSGATRRRTASSTRKTPCAGWTCSPPGACPSARNGRRRAPCCARPPRTRRTSPGSRGSTRSTARRKRPASASCARWRGSCPRPRRARTRR